MHLRPVVFICLHVLHCVNILINWYNAKWRCNIKITCLHTYVLFMFNIDTVGSMGLHNPKYQPTVTNRADGNIVLNTLSTHYCASLQTRSWTAKPTVQKSIAVPYCNWALLKCEGLWGGAFYFAGWVSITLYWHFKLRFIWRCDWMCKFFRVCYRPILQQNICFF